MEKIQRFDYTRVKKIASMPKRFIKRKKKGRSVSRSFRSFCMMTLTPECLDRLIYIFFYSALLIFFFHIQNPGIRTEWLGN